jgi:hypothetical protein
MLLGGAAQLITISALLSVDPLAATWASLLAIGTVEFWREQSQAGRPASVS